MHTKTQPDSPFHLLINDLEALRDAREIRENARAARQAHESARNRRLQQMQQQPRRLAKAAPVDQPAPNFEAIAARQERIAADLERSRIAAQQQAIRAHIATLMAAARAGRLDPHSVCVLDVLRGRADSMGIAP